jgi:hypothetical protein
MIPVRHISLTRAILEERRYCLQTQRHPLNKGKPPSHLLRCYPLKISPNMLSEYVDQENRFDCPVRTLGRDLRILAISSNTCVSYLSFLTTFRLTAKTMSLFVSPIAQPALAILSAPSYLGKGCESEAQPGLFPPESQHSPEQPAATGPVTAQPRSPSALSSVGPG